MKSIYCKLNSLEVDDADEESSSELNREQLTLGRFDCSLRTGESVTLKRRFDPRFGVEHRTSSLVTSVVVSSHTNSSSVVQSEVVFSSSAS